MPTGLCLQTSYQNYLLTKTYIIFYNNEHLLSTNYKTTNQSIIVRGRYTKQMTNINMNQNSLFCKTSGTSARQTLSIIYESAAGRE